MREYTKDIIVVTQPSYLRKSDSYAIKVTFNGQLFDVKYYILVQCSLLGIITKKKCVFLSIKLERILQKKKEKITCCVKRWTLLLTLAMGKASLHPRVISSGNKMCCCSHKKSSGNSFFLQSSLLFTFSTPFIRQLKIK